MRRHSSLAAAVGGLLVSTLRTASTSNPQLAQPAARWMLFNDFVIRETPPAEVQATYAGQKTPCMLYYTRVRQVSPVRAHCFYAVTKPRTLRSLLRCIPHIGWSLRG